MLFQKKGLPAKMQFIVDLFACLKCYSRKKGLPANVQFIVDLPVSNVIPEERFTS
jgi:hypothetical protein